MLVPAKGSVSTPQSCCTVCVPEHCLHRNQIYSQLHKAAGPPCHGLQAGNTVCACADANLAVCTAHNQQSITITRATKHLPHRGMYTKHCCRAKLRAAAHLHCQAPAATVRQPVSRPVCQTFDTRNTHTTRKQQTHTRLPTQCPSCSDDAPGEQELQHLLLPPPQLHLPARLLPLQLHLVSHPTAPASAAAAPAPAAAAAAAFRTTGAR